LEHTKTYFASDLHLGTPNEKKSRFRELLFVKWLDSIKYDAQAIYLVGDIFDFWHEYETVVPKGFVRLLGKLAELSDAGIELHIFTGNHDLWMKDYFTKELGAKVYQHPIQITINDKRFFIGHGDGLGPKDYGYKFIKKIFTNPICQFLFKWLHPDIGTRIAQYLSHQSRFGSGIAEMETFQGEENEWLLIYCKEVLLKEHFDYFIFGHRHLPIDFKLKETSRYINIGDWLHFNTYAVFDGDKLELKTYK
jgi:UDP-2,3-diacylglucosamine hydrolase